MYKSIWIGWEPKERYGWLVTNDSIKFNLSCPHEFSIQPLILDIVKDAGLYYRPTSFKEDKLWDDISQAPMSTEFAISRFLVPYLAKEGWALFMDCDMLIRTDLNNLFDLADDSKAVMVVKHNYAPVCETKKDGEVQTVYPRKNWSSLMLFNVEHPSNKALTVEMINTLPGRDLHRFCWLEDYEIGELSIEWNYLVGHNTENVDPKIVHFTEGLPNVPGYEHSRFSKEWFAYQILRWDREWH